MKNVLLNSLWLMVCLATARGETTIVVAPDGSGQFKTVQAAVDSIPANNQRPVVIVIRNGDYSDQLRVNKSFLTLRGQDRKKTRLCAVADSSRRTAQRSWATVEVDGAHDVTFEHLTITNPFQTMGGYAVALSSINHATQLSVVDCDLTSGGGDTVSPWSGGLYYFRDCRIAGTFHFFGPRGTCYVTSCQFWCLGSPISLFNEGIASPSDKLVIGDSTFDGPKPFGLGSYFRDEAWYFIDCKFSKQLMAGGHIFRNSQGREHYVPKWGENRIYFSGCKGPDYPWLKDNITTSPAKTGKAVTAYWTLRGWDPEVRVKTPPVEWSFDMTQSGQTIDTGLFFGTCHWPNTPELKQKFLPNMREHGIRLVRANLALGSVVSSEVCPDRETFLKRMNEPGFADSWNWKALNWIDDAKAEGFNVLVMTCYIPTCLTVNGTLPAKGDTATWKAWGEVCAQVVRRVEQKVDAIEGYNEAVFFAKPTNTGYRRSVEADPDIYYYAHERLAPLTQKPLGSPATWAKTWKGSALQTLPFDPRSKPDSLDFFSLHVYQTKLTTFFKQIDYTRQVLDGTARRGLPAGYQAPWRHKPLWLTEWDSYWKGRCVGMEWYGFVLTELLARSINNNIYNYKENMNSKDLGMQTPWLLMVKCGLNEKAQKIRVLPQIHPRAFDGVLTATAASLPDGSLVVIAANAGDRPSDARFRLSGLGMKQGTVSRWTALAGEAGLVEAGVSAMPALPVENGTLEIATTLPAKSMIALRVQESKL